MGATLGLGVGVTLTSDVGNSPMALLPLSLATTEVVVGRLVVVSRLVVVVRLGVVVGMRMIVELLSD